MWPSPTYRSAFSYKISLKSDNRSTSYGQKSDFQDWIFLKFFGHVNVIRFNIWCSVPNFIKIGRFLTEIWRFNDFQNGGRPTSWILKICSFCHAALVDIPFCFLIKFRWNRRISRWVMAKKAIFKMAAAAILNFKNFNFWSRDCHGVQYLL